MIRNLKFNLTKHIFMKKLLFLWIIVTVILSYFAETELELWISGLLGFTANLPYIYIIWKTRNSPDSVKPIRISWIMWLILDCLVLTNSWDANNSALATALPIGYTAGAFLVNLFAIPYGKWIDSGDIKGWKKFSAEIKILIICVIGIILWMTAGPTVSLVAFCFALVVSAWPTIKRIWLNPKKEPTIPWTMWFFASLISVIGLGNPMSWTIVGSIVSLVYFGMNIPITYAMYFRK